jgi:leucyl aminopeptidase
VTDQPRPSISVSPSPASATAGDVLVVGIAQGDDGPVIQAGSDVSRALLVLEPALRGLGLTGSADEVAKIPSPGGVIQPVVVLTGLGKQQRRFPPESLRRAAGAAARAAGPGRIVLALPVNGPAEVTARAVEAAATGSLLGAYTFTQLRTDSKNGDDAKDRPREYVVAVTGGSAREDKPGVVKAAKAAVQRAVAVAEPVALARDLVNLPPNILTPREFAAVAEREAGALGLEVSVLDDKVLRKEGYGGITGVGQGSANPPRLIRIAYRHPRAKQHLALVGKGITFDSGGISIKPAAHMEEMKSDMGGAAAVLATVLAVARLKSRVDITAWMAMAENMPSGSAQRPSDVLTIFGGKTVEVLNTDAEGRLVMADAIVAAAADSPDALIDVATLTGAARVALGVRTAGIMANDDGLRERIRQAADRAGEPMWPMPIPEEMRRGLDSSVADIANVDNARVGGMLSAAAFLREFVVDGQRWAHLDIAGPAYNSGSPFGYTPRGGTGVAVRTLVQLAEEMAVGDA